MAKKNKIVFDVLANTKKYTDGIRKSTDVTKAATKVMKAGFIALAATVTASTIAFGKFEKGMNDISTLIDTNTENLDKMGNQILSLAKDIPKPVSELVESMYDIRSAGVSAADSMAALRTSGKLAVAGLSTTKEATDILTTAMNTFKSEGRSAENIANILFKTVKFGKNTISQLATAFGQTAPLAKSAGLNLEEFSAATASLTAQGIPASVAQNQIRAAMVGLEKQTADMKKVFKALGFKDMKELMANSENLGDAFSKIRNQAIAMDIPLGKVTGRIEGANAITVIATEGAEIYNNALRDMASGTDAVTESFNKQAAGLDNLRQKMFNYVNVALISLGKQFKPAVQTVGDFTIGVLNEMIMFFNRNGAAIANYANMAAKVMIEGFTAIKNIISTTYDVLKSLGVGTLLTGMASAGMLVFTSFSAITDALGGFVKRAAKAVDDLGYIGTALKVIIGLSAAQTFISLAGGIGKLVTATKLWKGAMVLLNVALNANPIFLITSAVLGLGAVVYDIIVNFNEWRLTFNKLINNVVAGWKKAKRLFADEEGKKAIDKEIESLRKENELINKQTEALKRKKEEYMKAGKSRSEADKLAGQDLKEGKLGPTAVKEMENAGEETSKLDKAAKDAKKISDSEKDKTKAVEKGEAERFAIKMNAKVQAQRNEEEQNKKDIQLLEEWNDRAAAAEEGRYQEELQKLMERRENQKISDEEYNMEKEQANAEHLARLQAQNDQYWDERNKKQKKQDTFFYNAQKRANDNIVALQDGMYSELKDLLQAYAAQSKTAAMAYKAIAIGESIVATYLGASKALSSVPFPANIGAAALVTAKGLLQVANIRKQSFAVGTDSVPEDMLANIHKGEGIIPAKQNQFLQSGKLALVSPDMIGVGSPKEGNPSFMEEIKRMLFERGEIDININMAPENMMDFIEAQVIRRRAVGASKI